jgi:hypothetical protein
MTIPDDGLAELLASPALLAQMWPGASSEVMMLIHLLRMTGSSLAEVLAIGLVQLLTPPAGMPLSLVGLALRTAVLTAVALQEDGERVAEPHLRTAEVRWLEVTDVAVGGRSGLRMAV